MEVGIGLPNAVRGVDRAGIVEWSRRAETAGFSSLGTIDRIVYSNYESLIALAAAAAVTERIGLDHRHPHRPVAREHRAVRQAGRDDRRTLWRPADAGSGRRRPSRRFRGEWSRLPRAWSHIRAPARADDVDLGGRRWGRAGAGTRRASRIADRRTERRGIPASGEVRRRLDDGRRRTGRVRRGPGEAERRLE